MADRYTKKDAENAFERLCKLTGHRSGPWNDVGAWQLDCNHVYGGYMIVEIANEHGGQSTPFGPMRRNAREFCNAVRFAEDTIRSCETLSQIHRP